MIPLVITPACIPYLPGIIRDSSAEFQQELVSHFTIHCDFVDEWNDRVCEPFLSREEKISEPFCGQRWQVQRREIQKCAGGSGGHWVGL